MSDKQTGDIQEKIRDILCEDEQEHFTDEYYEEMKVGEGVWYIAKVERLSTLLSQELAKRDETKDNEWAEWISKHDYDLSVVRPEGHPHYGDHIRLYKGIDLKARLKEKNDG